MFFGLELMDLVTDLTVLFHQPVDPFGSLTPGDPINRPVRSFNSMSVVHGQIFGDEDLESGSGHAAVVLLSGAALDRLSCRFDQQFPSWPSGVAADKIEEVVCGYTVVAKEDTDA